MRSGGYPPTGPGMSGQTISQQTGPTPTLNSLLQPGGAGGGAGGSAGGAGATAPPGAAPPSMPGHNSPHRYPPPPGGYEYNSHNMPPHSKSDYPAGPQGWPPPGSNQRPPVNAGYGHPPPPSFQQQQAMYRQVCVHIFSTCQKMSSLKMPCKRPFDSLHDDDHRRHQTDCYYWVDVLLVVSLSRGNRLLSISLRFRL